MPPGSHPTREGLLRHPPKSTCFIIALVAVPKHAVAAPCIGRPRPHRRDTHPGRRRVSGQASDGRYSWARYYHPGLQRFISEDPLGVESGSWNLYGYVDNNPLTYVDPLGLEKERRSCGTRDYVSLSGTLAILNPVTGTLLGGAGQLTLDRYGQIYLGGGVSGGRSLFLGSVSFMTGRLLGDTVPNQERLASFLGGHTVSAGGGFISAVGLVWSPGNGFAEEGGLSTPQAGASYIYSIRLARLQSLGWGCTYGPHL